MLHKWHSAGIIQSQGTLKSCHHYFQTQVRKCFMWANLEKDLCSCCLEGFKYSTLQSNHSENWELYLWTCYFFDSTEPLNWKYLSFSYLGSDYPSSGALCKHWATSSHQWMLLPSFHSTSPYATLEEMVIVLHRF